MHNKKIETWIPTCIFLKITASFVMSLRLLILALLLSFKITNYNKKLEVYNK